MRFPVGDVWFGVLGPLSVLDGELDRTPRPAKLRTLLALLLVHAGEPVAVPVLVDGLWDDDPPATATTALQVYVSQLRQLLAAGVPPRDPAQPLQTARPGYRLVVAPGASDLHRFRALADRGAGRLAAGDAAAAAEDLAVALRLWRGAAFADLPGRVLHDVHGPALEEQRLAVHELHAQAQLALGRTDAVIAELAGPVAEHPMRERLVGQLMVALERAGRRGDALVTYERTRRTLADELGIDPGPDLRAVHAAVLTGSAPAGGPRRPVTGGRPPADPAATVPAQLPPAVPDFTGREDATAAAVAALVPADAAERSAPACCEVTGPGGAGKTALAVQAAHRLRDRFPDGQLMTTLRGVAGSPADPGDVLTSFLVELGLDGRFVPHSVEERSRLFRSRLAGRRVLVVLDDAGSEAQVRPLLPGTAGCAVLITGRSRLLGLEGVRTIRLDVLAPPDAAALLAKVVGADRVAAEPAAAADVVRHCGYLPLAVRIAGARLSAKPHWTLAGFAAALADERRRLDELVAGDLEVRASIGLSYRTCRPEDRRALHLLARLGLPDVPAWLVAALLDVDVRVGSEVVERLVDVQLVQVAGIDAMGQVRYRLHDLVRLFAVEHAEAGHGETDVAVDRVAEAYAALLGRAERAAHPGRPPEPPGPPAPWPPDDALLATVDTDPLGWSTTELTALLGVLRRAHAAGSWPVVLRLADRVTWVVDVRSDWTGWRDAQELALDAARRSGDRAGEAVALRRRAELEWELGRAGRAVADAARSRCGHRRLGDRYGAARAALVLAGVHLDRGSPRRATALLDDAAPVLAEVGDRRGQAELLRQRGLLHRDRGELEDADRCLTAAARTFHELGDRRWWAYVLRGQVRVRRAQGRLAEAQALAEECLVSFRGLADRRWEGYALLSLAEVDLDRAHLAAAGERFARCVELFAAVGDRRAEAHALCSLGDVRRAEGHPQDAIELAGQGHALFAELDEPRGRALAALALGRACADAGSQARAAGWFSEAAERFGRLGLAARRDEALAGLDRATAAVG